MPYKPKIVKGRVKGTGYPIEGHVLYFALYDYDNHESFHLYGWDDADDAAVMMTIYQDEKTSGLCDSETLETFSEMWKAKEWIPARPFCLPLAKVEVLEVMQEEERDATRDKLLGHGIDLTPRKETDRGGILCLPMEKNLNGDIKAKHPDWELIECPHCGRKCWKTPGVDRMVEEQGVQLLCTACALSAGLVRPFRKTDDSPKPSGNREQRRRANREK